MVPDSTLVGQAPELGLDRAHASKAFSGQQTEAPGGVNVVWPGEEAPVPLNITNTSGKPIQGAGLVHVIRYAVNGQPGDA